VVGSPALLSVGHVPIIGSAGRFPTIRAFQFTAAEARGRRRSFESVLSNHLPESSECRTFVVDVDMRPETIQRVPGSYQVELLLPRASARRSAWARAPKQIPGNSFFLLVVRSPS